MKMEKLILWGAIAWVGYTFLKGQGLLGGTGGAVFNPNTGTWVPGPQGFPTSGGAAYQNATGAWVTGPQGFPVTG